MDKAFLIKLTNDLYRLTLLFPKKEPLRYKMRELAADILAGPGDKDLEVLNHFFEIAKAQNWVAFGDILAIQADYDNLRKETTKNLPGGAEIKTPLLVKNLLERQDKILAILREKGRAQVWEIKQIFPQVSKRTLRRDFEFLLKKGVIERMGEKNNTFYQVKIG
jgi:molecular chaperone GrpE (heat shock protein)